jgi:SAM-dependent methyltransferase
MGGTEYTKKYGGSKVSRTEVLHYIPGNGYATIVGDLTNTETLEAEFFDCIILTQTLQLIYDFRSAINNLYRALKPNGVVLVTTHGTSKIDNFIGEDPWGEYWRFTGQSSQIAFEDSFGKGNVEVITYGNILSATAFLQGLVVEDLSIEELEFHDPRFEVLVGIRAFKRSSL